MIRWGKGLHFFGVKLAAHDDLVLERRGDRVDCDPVINATHPGLDYTDCQIADAAHESQHEARHLEGTVRQ